MSGEEPPPAARRPRVSPARRRAQVRRRRLVLLAGATVVVTLLTAPTSLRRLVHPHPVHLVTATRTPPQAAAPPRALDPTLYSPGACVVYAPSVGNRHRTVFLDAGHGGIDPGGIGTTESGRGISEAELNLPIELDTAALLRAQGFRVVVSRTRPTTVLRLRTGDVSDGALTLQGAHDDITVRDLCANRAGADILIGIYMDAGYSPKNAGSLTAYDAARPFARANRRLATLVQTDVLAAMNAQGWGIPDDGVVTDTRIGSRPPTTSTSSLAADAIAYRHLLLLGPAMPGYATAPSRMPGALIEPLYVTDPFEGTVAASQAGQRAIATGLARAVLQYFAAP